MRLRALAFVMGAVAASSPVDSMPWHMWLIWGSILTVGGLIVVMGE